jgi:hypothetical protein
MPMHEDIVLEKLEELISLVRVLDTKIQFVMQDIEDLKQDELFKIKNCVEQLARKQLDQIQQQEASKWTVERL